MKYANYFEDCYVKLENGILAVGNSLIERCWNVEGDIPLVQSLENKKTGRQWMCLTDNLDWLENPAEKYAFYKKGITEGGKKDMTISSEPDDDFGIGRKHLKVTVGLEYDRFLVEWMHMVYPGTALHRSMLQVTRKKDAPLQQGSGETKGMLPYSDELADDFCDSCPIAFRHCEWDSVKFRDYTDDNDNLVEGTHGIMTRRENRYLYGNLLMMKDILGEEGITFIKEGPTPRSCLGDTRSDFYLHGQNVFTTGWGVEERDFRKAETISCYGSAVVLWDGGGENKYFSLNEYHRARHDFVPGKDAFLMSNTWGDSSCDGKIGEKFLLEELKRAKETGINLYQIDDGWQNGTTCNSVNADLKDNNAVWGEGYYKSNPGFWEVNGTRFPNGLERIVEYAEENGIRLGLWFSPDSDNDFENWERDSQVLLDLHRKYGIAAFKMDGVRLRNKVSEDNLAKLLQRVIQESDGKVIFNMDVTTDTRSGYFGRVHYGSLFVENRFTAAFGAYPNYYPHRTLRNLWILSQYYPTNRLQMEFVNVKRNAQLYGEDVLSPANCGLEYSFAVTMFANPLAWMELTGLDQESADLLSGIIPVYQKVQGDILAGQVLPIGEEPRGVRWTGFQSVKSDTEGYLLILKEYNEAASHAYTLWSVKGKTLKLEPLLGYGKQECVEVSEEGRAVFELEGRFTYALYRYTAVHAGEAE